MVLAARVSLLLSVIAAILVVTIGGTFLSYGNALQADGMPTMARLMEWDGQLRYRYTVNDKVFENTDTLPKNFAGLDGNFVRVTYLPYRPDVAHVAPKELAARGGMILIVGVPLAAIFVWASATSLLRSNQRVD